MLGLDFQLVLKGWTLYFYSKQLYINTWKRKEKNYEVKHKTLTNEWRKILYRVGLITGCIL